MLIHDQEKPDPSWLRLILCFSTVPCGTAGAAYLLWQIHWVAGVVVIIPMWILLADLVVFRRRSLTWYLLDFLRYILVFAGTAVIIQFLWKIDWRLGAIAAIPIFVLLLNLI